MESEVIKLALSQGIWAVISVFLILYILKNQEKRDIKQDEREKSYQDIISNLTDKLNLIENVKKDVESITKKGLHFTFFQIYVI
ncbi:MAG: BhlA/UviB family holin-like peptide [Clostridium sp.]